MAHRSQRRAAMQSRSAGVEHETAVGTFSGVAPRLFTDQRPQTPTPLGQAHQNEAASTEIL